MDSITSPVSDKSPARALGLMTLIIFAGFVVVGPMIGLGVAALMYDGNLLLAMQGGDLTGLTMPMLVSQGIAALVGLIIFPILYLKLVEQKSLSPFFKFNSTTLLSVIILSFAGITFLIVLSPIVEWNAAVKFPEVLRGFEHWARDLEDQAAKLTEAFTKFNSFSEFLFGMVVIALIPGFGEELVFRGLYQNEFNRAFKNIHVAIWLSAILFSAIHLEFFGFFPRVFLGAFFGYAYYWSGNLFIPMFAHFFHNGFTLTMMYLFQRGMINTNIENDSSASWLAVLLCAAITTLLLFVFRNYQSSSDATDTLSAS